MASPQTENGYARVATELLEAVYRFPFSGQELRLILWVVRASYGWGRKDTAPVSVRGLAEAVALPASTVSWAVNGLVTRGVVLRTEAGGLTLNKNYSEWLGRAGDGALALTPRAGGGRGRIEEPVAYFPSDRLERERRCARCGSETRRVAPSRRRDGTVALYCVGGCPKTRAGDADRTAKFLEEHSRRKASTGGGRA